MPEVGALRAGPRTTGTVCPMTPGALRVEDSRARCQLSGVGAGERSGLRSQHRRGHEQGRAETETDAAAVLDGSLDEKTAGTRD
jgi:hypothetical protein